MLGCGPATDSLAWLRLLRELPSLGIPAAPLYPPPVYLAWLRPHQHLSWTPSCNELVGSQIQELSLIAPFPSTSVTHQCPGARCQHPTCCQHHPPVPITFGKLSFLTQPHLPLSPHPLKVKVHSSCSPCRPPFSHLLTWLATAHLLGPCSNVTPKTPSLAAPPREPLSCQPPPGAPPSSGGSSPSEVMVLGPRGQGVTLTSLALYPGQTQCLVHGGLQRSPLPPGPGSWPSHTPKC